MGFSLLSRRGGRIVSPGHHQFILRVQPRQAPRSRGCQRVGKRPHRSFRPVLKGGCWHLSGRISKQPSQLVKLCFASSTKIYIRISKRHIFSRFFCCADAFSVVHAVTLANSFRRFRDLLACRISPTFRKLQINYLAQFCRPIPTKLPDRSQTIGFRDELLQLSNFQIPQKKNVGQFLHSFPEASSIFSTPCRPSPTVMCDSTHKAHVLQSASH